METGKTAEKESSEEKADKAGKVVTRMETSEEEPPEPVSKAKKYFKKAAYGLAGFVVLGLGKFLNFTGEVLDYTNTKLISGAPGWMKDIYGLITAKGSKKQK